MNKVFIDGGAHKGEAIEMLLNKRPDLNGCEIHFFEPNPDLIPLLNNMVENETSYTIQVHHSALWINNDGVDFLESIERWNTLASTIIPSMNEIWGLKLDRNNPKKVPSTSISEFLDRFGDEDYLVVKLDIEGSEYFVIEDLLKTGKIKKINELYIEWHDHFFPHFKELGNNLRNSLSKITDIKLHNDWI